VKSTFILYPFFWAIGLKYVYLYFMFLVAIKLTVNNVKEAFKRFTPFFFIAFLFLVYQIISTCIGVFISDISLIRLIAIFHNYFIYLIFVVVAAVATFRDIKVPLYVILICIFVTFLYLFLYMFNLELFWEGLLEKVVFAEKGYLGEGSLIRLSVFSDYYNATAILFIGVFYLLYKDSVGDSSVLSVLLYLLFLVMLFATGSRMIVALFLFFIPFLFIRNFYITLVGYFILCCLVLMFLSDILLFLDSLREDSSGTRKFIYNYSIAYVEDVNPYTGLGYKPKFDWMKYPVGSHSSFVGYYVKNGFIGIFLWLLLIMTMLYYCSKAMFLSPKHERQRLFFKVVMLLVLIVVFGLEDLDAFELNAFVFGLVFGGILSELRASEDRSKSKV
jgi:hypothetical protein